MSSNTIRNAASMRMSGRDFPRTNKSATRPPLAMRKTNWSAFLPSYRETLSKQTPRLPSETFAPPPLNPPKIANARSEKPAHPRVACSYVALVLDKKDSSKAAHWKECLDLEVLEQAG